MSKVECIYCLEQIKQDCLVSHLISDIDKKTFCQKRFLKEKTHILDQREYIARKKSILVDKLKSIEECSSQRTYTSVIDTKIINLQSLLAKRPIAIQILRKKLQSEIDKIMQKLQKKKKKLEELTLENDSYSRYLESQISQQKQQRQAILDNKKKTKEQITLEYKIQNLDKELEKLNVTIKEEFNENCDS